MTIGETKSLPSAFDVLAPDGSEVRVLLAMEGGSMAHFLLPRGEASRAVRHRTVGEIWYVLSGHGEMWRAQGDVESITALAPGICISIPAGVVFQFRNLGDAPLTAVAVTMPPWPGADEADPANGKWPATRV